MKGKCLQSVNGGAVLILKRKRQFTCRLSNNITFFHNVRRIE